MIGLAVGGLVAGAASTGIQAYSAHKRSQAEEAAAKYKADEFERNAVAARKQAEAYDVLADRAVSFSRKAEAKFLSGIEQLKSTQKSKYAASGVQVSSGSALDVMEDTSYQGTVDALDIRLQGRLEQEQYIQKASDYRRQAGSYVREAEMLRTQGYGSGLEIAGTVLTGASNLGSQYFSYANYGAFG